MPLPKPPHAIEVSEIVKSVAVLNTLATLQEAEAIKTAIAANVVRTLAVANLIEEAAVAEAIETLAAAGLLQSKYVNMAVQAGRKKLPKSRNSLLPPNEPSRAESAEETTNGGEHRARSEGAPQKTRITLRGAIFIGIGSMVGAGIFALFGEAGAIAGAAVWVSFLVGGIIALLQGYSFSKLGARYPSAAASSIGSCAATGAACSRVAS